MSALTVLLVILAGIFLVAVVVIVAGLVNIALPTRGLPIRQYDNPQKALLIIDVQEDFTTTSDKHSFPPEAVDRMIAAVNRVTRQASDRGIPVIFVRQEFDNWLTIMLAKIGAGGHGIKGNLGTRLDLRISRTPGSIDITKPKGDAFSNPELDAYLRQQQVNELYLMGLDGVGCVNRTAQGALNRGYRVNFIMDGIITRYKNQWNNIVVARNKDGVGVIAADKFPD
jgi:nicotinamidase-related amidase